MQFSLIRRGLAPSLVLLVIVSIVRGDDWPQWLGPQRDGVWRETGILDKFPEGGPKVRWRTPIGAGYSGPAVANGKVYVTDRVLSPGVSNPASPFDAKQSVNGQERVLCLDETSGKSLWQHAYDCPYKISYAAGPRTTPLVHQGKVYTLGAMGHLLCLDAANGDVGWSKNLPTEYKTKPPYWGYSAHPLIDGDKLITLVGGAGSAVVAFHKDTGKEMWRSLSTRDIGYCPPTLFESNGKRELIIWHSESINGLDPETGKLLWSQPFLVRAGMSIPTPRQEGDNLFISCFYNGSMMLKIDPDQGKAVVVWKGKSNQETPDKTDGLHCVMSTPFEKDGYIYGICSYGELRCLKAATGERVWKSMKATTGGPGQRWANAFIVAQGDRYFLFNESGDLIIAKLNPEEYQEISRAHILDPTNRMVAPQRAGNESVVWTHPAFANRCMFARNDKEIVCVSLAAEEKN